MHRVFCLIYSSITAHCLHLKIIIKCTCFSSLPTFASESVAVSTTSLEHLTADATDTAFNAQSVLTESAEFASDQGDESDLEAEKEGEIEKVKAAFARMNSNDGESISGNQFPMLFKELGATYSEEYHSTILRKVEDRHGRVPLQSFLDWYILWMFEGDDDVESEESVDYFENEPFTGFGGRFKPSAGQWKCDACSVLNAKDSTKCASCTTARLSNLGAVSSEKDVVQVLASSPRGAGFIGASGFSFPVPSSPRKSEKTVVPSVEQNRDTTPCSPSAQKGFIGLSGFNFPVVQSEEPAAQSQDAGILFS